MKKCKKLFMIVALLMLFVVCTGTAYADDDELFECNGFKCRIESDKNTVVICGRAEGNQDEEIYIPSSITYAGITYPITGIDPEAFWSDGDIKKLDIGAGITEIGERAFCNCSFLSEISLPDTIEHIGYWAFFCGYEENEENWDNGVLYIDDYMIRVNSDDEFIIREGTKLIADRAAFQNTKITSVMIPESVQHIGSFAFAFCSNLETVSFTGDSQLKVIAGGTFGDCSSLTNINIPTSVTKIEDFAFNGCSSITSISIPESVSSIGEGAFTRCSSITSISIPENVRSIGEYAFEVCESLRSIEVSSNNAYYSAIEGVLYDKKQTKLIRCPETKEGQFLFLIV